MPSIDLSLNLIPLLIGGYFFLLALHELGNTLAGRLVGLQIAATGIGQGKAMVKIRIGRTIYFIGRENIMGGITVPVSEHLAIFRWKTIFYVAGGPVANIFTAIVTMVLWHLGYTYEVVSILFYISLFLVIISTIPFSVPAANGVVWRNNAMVIIQLIRGTFVGSHPPGIQISTSKMLIQLSRELDSWEGIIYYTLILAGQLVSISDSKKARELLEDKCFQDPRRNGFAGELECCIRTILLLSEEWEESEKNIQAALEICKKCPVMVMGLELAGVEALLNQGRPALEAADRVLNLAHSLKRYDLTTAARVLQMEAMPPKDYFTHSQRILKDSLNHSIAGITALRLSCVATRHFAEQGQSREARILFEQSRQLLLRLACSIQDQESKEAFLKHYSQILEQAQDKMKDSLPLYITEMFPPLPSGKITSQELQFQQAEQRINQLGLSGIKPRGRLGLGMGWINLAYLSLLIPISAVWGSINLHQQILLVCIILGLVWSSIEFFQKNTSRSLVVKGFLLNIGLLFLWVLIMASAQFVPIKSSSQTGLRTIDYANGSKYQGQTKGGKRQGYGMQWDPKWRCYIGGWKGEKRDGYGMEWDGFGNLYMGEWKKDRRHGSGVLFDRKGQLKYWGRWVKGRYQGNQGKK